MSETHTSAQGLTNEIRDGILLGSPGAVADIIVPVEYMVADGQPMFMFELTINGRHMTVAVLDTDVMPDGMDTGE